MKLKKALKNLKVKLSPKKVVEPKVESVVSELNCPECAGSGLLDSYHLCSRCLGKGKV